ncbi:MAG: M20/M25/M40 family metallo-hydrolase, partial [Candidatus Sulfotelmatobacter sp.]
MPSKKIASKKSRSPASHWLERLHFFEQRQPALVATTCEFAGIESPSDDKPSADTMCMHLARKFEGLGGSVRIHHAENYGNNLQIDFAGRASTQPVLLLGHYDTVYPLRTLATMPVREVDGRLHGPGVLDMKSGIALMWHAIEALQQWHGQLPRPVTVFLVSDEEVGSESSRPLTEALAQKSAAVFVLEPAAGLRGAVKTERKGVGEYTLNVQGIAAHAGLDPTKGHSAILELARQITAIAKLNDLKQGLSLNVGVIRGGTRTNVIAAEAIADIDARIRHAKQAAALDRKLRALKPFDKQCRLTLEGGINRMPME